MKIKDLFDGINYELLQGDENINIKFIENNHKNIHNKETLFVCISGLKFDGHSFIKDLDDNTVAIIVDKEIDFPKNKTVIKVENTRKAMAFISFNFYNKPQNKVKVIGVTGTSGKTSTTIIIETILMYSKNKVAVIGTLGCNINGENIPMNSTTITTPDSLELSYAFNCAANSNVDYVVMEASSHALALNRVDSINFEVGIFTNIGIDHLDFHKTVDEYAEAKFKLFEISKKCVLNIDDKYGSMFYNRLKNVKEILSISLNNRDADLYAYNINITPNGTYFDFNYKNKEYKNNFVNLIGYFNIYNVLSSIATCILVGININDIVNSLKKIKPIPGRCEIISNYKGINIVIEYAHTPEQFDNVLSAMKKFTKGKLISLFGLGGGRYALKRPIMGEVAAKYSDFVVIGEDNPRDEDPNEINRQIEIGLKKTNVPYKLFVDRKEAIEFALSMAKSGDTFITMGKGQEIYQEYENKRRVYFCEREIIENYLKNKK